MEKPEISPSRNAGAIFGGIALVVVGLVVFVPSGLCTGLLVVSPIIVALTHPPHPTGWDSTSMSVIALAIGGPFVFGGATMIWFGVKALIDAFSKRG